MPFASFFPAALPISPSHWSSTPLPPGSLLTSLSLPPLRSPPLSPDPAGSPQEEASLVEHVAKLAPSPGQLEEAGQLCELLVLLGHFEDAKVLQQEMAKWLAAHQVGGVRGRERERHQGGKKTSLRPECAYILPERALLAAG